MKEAVLFEAHSSYVLDLRFTRDGQSLVSCGMDNQVRLWSASDWSLRRTFAGHSHSVGSLALAPNEQTLASASTECLRAGWETAGARVCGQEDPRMGAVGKTHRGAC
jgi:WD40 repeat protein